MPNSEISILPVLPLKNTILFPGLMLPLSVGRELSLKAVNAALQREEKEVVLIAQRDAQVDVPGQDDLYTIGTKAVIRKSSRPDDGIMEILVLGVERVVVVKVEEKDSYLPRSFVPWRRLRTVARNSKRSPEPCWSWQRKPLLSRSPSRRPN